MVTVGGGAVIGVSSVAIAHPEGGGGGGMITIQGGNLPRPATHQDLQALATAFCASGRKLVLDPTTVVTISDSIMFDMVGASGHWGIDGNGARIEAAGSWPFGKPLFHFRNLDPDGNPNGTANRGLTIERLTVYGHVDSGPCVLVEPAHGGAAIYQALIRDLFLAGCGGKAGGVLAGIGDGNNPAETKIGALMLYGASFELMVRDVRSENHRCHGVSVVNAPQIAGGNHPSNIMVQGLNASRNAGAAIFSEHSSFDLVGFSSVLNGQGIAVCPTGFRLIADGNGENTGIFGITGGGFGCIRNVEVTGHSNVSHGYEDPDSPMKHFGNHGLSEAVFDMGLWAGFSKDLVLAGRTQHTSNGAPASYLGRVSGDAQQRVYLEPWMSKGLVSASGGVVVLQKTAQ